MVILPMAPRPIDSHPQGCVATAQLRFQPGAPSQSPSPWICGPSLCSHSLPTKPSEHIRAQVSSSQCRAEKRQRRSTSHRRVGVGAVKFFVAKISQSGKVATTVRLGTGAATTRSRAMTMTTALDDDNRVELHVVASHLSPILAAMSICLSSPKMLPEFRRH